MAVKIKSEKRHNLEILLEKLKGITKLGEDNKVSFTSIQFDDLEWIFLSIIDFGNSLCTDSKKTILINTIKQLAISNNYEKHHFLNLLDNQIIEHNRKKEKKYYLLTALSIRNLPFRKINIGKCQIIIHGKHFPIEFRTNRNTIVKSHSQKEDQKNFTKVTVVLKSRDYKDAYEQSYQYLEIFRSLLCLVLNSSKEIRFFDRTLKPINKVRQGEIFTLHNEDGTNVDNKTYWYVPNYKEAKILELNNEKREKLKSTIRLLVKRYNKCKVKHQDSIGKALKIYVSAFDENNKYICFLQAWTVLETLLNTDQNDILIKRCIAMYNIKSRPYEKQMLESLRQYRNEYVHEGDNGLDPLNACFNIQIYIFNLIVKFNLMYSGFFNNIEEANLFLDNYSPDLKELKTRKKIIDKAINLKEKNTKR